VLDDEVKISSKTFEVPIYEPRLPLAPKILPYLERIDRSGWYSNYGPLSKLLESRLAHRIGMKSENVVTVVNATLALQGAIATSVNNQGWNCPSWTFAATAHSVLGAGRNLHLLDISEDWRLDPRDPRSFSGNFMDVLPFGDDVNLERFPDGTENVIIDAAGSFDSIKNLDLGSRFPVGVVISFHPTKALAGGEGALFISNDSDWVSRVRGWANFGFDENRIAIRSGTNAKMSEYACAVTLASFDQWESDRKQWVQLLNWATSTSSEFGLGIHPAMRKGYVSPYWIVEGEPTHIERLKALMINEGIQTRQWWGSGCHKMPAFDKYATGAYPRTDSVSERTLGLPFFKGISEDQRGKIIAAFGRS
jgi:dTDP-4-amino-4,6-dideoxygalactose transaminase